MLKFRLPLIKIYTLHIINKKLKYEFIMHFFSIKKARRYFESMNQNDEYEVSLDIGVLQL